MIHRSSRYMLLSVLFFSIMAALVKATPEIGTAEKVLFRGLIGVVFIYLLMRKKTISIRGKNTKGLIFRGLSGHFAIVCYFYSLQSLELADAMMIQNFSPILINLLAPWLIHERFEFRKFTLALLGVVGVAFVIKPQGDVGWVPGLVALMGAIASSFSHVTVRRLGQSEHPLRIVFYFPLISALLSVPGVALNFSFPSPHQSLMLLGIGITAALGQVFMTKAYQLERVGDLSILNYLGVAVGGAVGFLFFSEIPDPWSGLGIGLVLISGLFIAVRFRRPPSTPTPPVC